MATGQENRDMTQGTSGAHAGPDWNALKEDVGEMAETAMEQGRHFLDSAGEQATGYLDQRKNTAAQSVIDLANTLRESGSAFEGKPSIRAVVESAAGGLEQLADGIRSRSFADLLGDVETVVRRRPAVAAAATMAAGFLLARFVKASTDAVRAAGQQGQQFGGAGQWQAQRTPGSDASPRGQGA